jgi:hypothetical protein
LFARDPVLFRKKKRFAEDDEGGYSRKQSRGIQIPTSIPAVVDQWANLRKQVQLWAWEVIRIVRALPFVVQSRNNFAFIDLQSPKLIIYNYSFQGRSRIVSKEHGKCRDLLLDKAMRCHRCVAYTSKVAPRQVILFASQTNVLQYIRLLPLLFFPEV